MTSYTIQRIENVLAVGPICSYKASNKKSLVRVCVLAVLFRPPLITALYYTHGAVLLLACAAIVNILEPTNKSSSSL